MDVTSWISYGGLGVLAGLLAGLLGVGGGIIIVPMLTFLFASQHLPDAHIAHLAIGTSLATIVFTSISSMKSHNARGAVEWGIFKSISPGILVGSLFGTWVAAQLSTRFLKGFFVVFLIYVSIQMFLEFKPSPRKPVGNAGMFGFGSLIGGISALVGIGGGTMSVPLLLWHSVPIRSAIGTSAAIGFPIAIAGTTGYILNGLREPTLPPYTFGYIYLPALFGVSFMSMLTAPLGTKIAHRIPVKSLKKGFACFLVLVAGKMLWGLL
jgi:uncharacterized membrane protein YfcA